MTLLAANEATAGINGNAGVLIKAVDAIRLLRTLRSKTAKMRTAWNQVVALATLPLCFQGIYISRTEIVFKRSLKILAIVVSTSCNSKPKPVQTVFLRR